MHQGFRLEKPQRYLMGDFYLKIELAKFEPFCYTRTQDGLLKTSN